jgi:hypothetical protein
MGERTHEIRADALRVGDVLWPSNRTVELVGAVGYYTGPGVHVTLRRPGGHVHRVHYLIDQKVRVLQP